MYSTSRNQEWPKPSEGPLSQSVALTPPTPNPTPHSISPGPVTLGVFRHSPHPRVRRKGNPEHRCRGDYASIHTETFAHIQEVARRFLYGVSGAGGGHDDIRV